MEYCGIEPIKTTFIGPVNNLDDVQKIEWLDKIADLAKKDTIKII